MTQPLGKKKSKYVTKDKIIDKNPVFFCYKK